MNITKRQLKKIIKEEYSRLLLEAEKYQYAWQRPGTDLGKYYNKHVDSMGEDEEEAFNAALVAKDKAQYGRQPIGAPRTRGPRGQSLGELWADLWTSPEGAKTGTISAKQRAAGEKQPSGAPGRYPYGSGGWGKVARPAGPSTSAWKTGGGTSRMKPMVKGGAWETKPKQGGYYMAPEEKSKEEELFDALLDTASYAVPMGAGLKFGSKAVKAVKAARAAKAGHAQQFKIPKKLRRKAAKAEQTKMKALGRDRPVPPEVSTRQAAIDRAETIRQQQGIPHRPGLQRWPARKSSPASGKPPRKERPGEKGGVWNIEDIFGLHGPVKPKPKP